MMGPVIETIKSIKFEIMFLTLCELWLMWHDLVESSLGLAMLQLNEQAVNNYVTPWHRGLHGRLSTQHHPNMCFKYGSPPTEIPEHSD